MRHQLKPPVPQMPLVRVRVLVLVRVRVQGQGQETEQGQGQVRRIVLATACFLAAAAAF